MNAWAIKLIATAATTAGIFVGATAAPALADETDPAIETTDLSQVGQEVVGDFAPTESSDFTSPGDNGRTLKVGPCRLDASVMHKRKSGNWMVMGNKPTTKCDTNVTSISHKTTIYKSALLGVLSLNQGNFSGGNRGVKTYEQKNVFHPCTNTKKTTWFAVTDGTIIYKARPTTHGL